MTHYHAVVDRRKEPWNGVATEQEAHQLVNQLVDALVADRRNAGGGAAVSRLTFGGMLVTYGDHYEHGASTFTTTACTVDHTMDAQPGELLKGAVAEVWPLGATKAGPWLLTGNDGLRTGHLPQRTSVEDAVLHMLGGIGATGHHLAVQHGTSCRDDGIAVVQTHVAVVDCPALDPAEGSTDDIFSHWPDAVPLSLEVLQESKPATHAANRAPDQIEFIWVLAHAARHLAWLLDNDAEAADKMPPLMVAHLRKLQPELYRMYDLVHPGTVRAA